MYVVVPLFSTPLYCSSIGVIEEKLLSKLPYHNYRAIVSSDLCHISHDEDILEEYPELKEHILYHFNTYADKVLNIDLSKIGFKIADAWIVKTYPGGNSPFAHNHTNSLFTGVIYLDAKDKGDITFIKQSGSNDMDTISFDIPYKDDSSIYSAKVWTYTPTDGDIIIFPSGTFHNIKFNESKQSRYSLAFNIVPTGTISSRSGIRLTYD
ncbi:Conserved hypothetical protein CHP02466 [uncultured Caudovirales phage]|uniref:Uncharacterized protein n=1 Tax=uncultured Caudovirales phage TaxID=2100421 RepID=A0A6J7WV61_9CAUD|nr:Conserved hypothetical protein CHP02466 [uncultured Caudovirales phage]